jgi:hypothetical protein
MNHQPGAYMYLTEPHKLREWLTYRGISYRELGQAVGVSGQFIGQLVQGTRRTCRPQTARKIEKFLLPPMGQRAPDMKPLFVLKRSDWTGEPSETVVAAR